MSRQTYQDLWEESMEDLAYLLEDEVQDKQVVRRMRAKEDIVRVMASYYIKYLRIYQKLEDAYDQMLHPQKRDLMGRTLDAVMGRMLEFKEDLVSRMHTEYLRFDDLLLDLKLEPDALELRPPRYFVANHVEELRRMDEKILQVQLAQSAQMDDSDEERENQMSLEEAIMLVQRHERARQGKRRFNIMQELSAKEREATQDLFDMQGELEADRAAMLIQRNWRGAMARSLYKNKKVEYEEFLGMLPSPKSRDSKDVVEVAESRRAGYRALQTKYQLDFANEAERKKETIMERQKPLWEETMQNDAKMYVAHHIAEYDKFPDFPKGGTAEWEGIEYTVDSDDSDYEEEKPKKRKKKQGEKGKGAGKGKAAAATTPSSSSTGGDKTPRTPRRYGMGRNKKEDEAPKTPLSETKFDNIRKLGKHTTRYQEQWKDRNEESNFKQKADLNLYEEHVTPKLEQEVRKQVDELLAVTMAKWKRDYTAEKRAKARAARKGRKGRKGATGSGNNTGKGTSSSSSSSSSGAGASSSPRRRAGHRRNAGGTPRSGGRNSGSRGGSREGRRGGRRRRRGGHHRREVQDIDIDPVETAEFQDLVAYGVIQQLPQHTMSDFVGQHKFVETVPAAEEEQLVEPTPAMADLRRVVTETCIMPLGSAYVRKNCKNSKAVLLYGNEGTGKELMAQIVAASAGAVLIDLSPRKLEGKFPGPLGAKHLMNLVKAVTKIAQPAVVYVENIDHVFSAKRRKSARIKYAPADRPTRLKKHIVAMVKRWKDTDRCLLLGSTHTPWFMDNRSVANLFTRHLYFPNPDYSSRQLLWKHLVHREVGPEMIAAHHCDAELDYATLARFSDQFTVANIHTALLSLLHLRRRRTLAEEPLAMQEVLTEMAKITPAATGADMIAFRKKLPHSKARVVEKEELDALEEERKKQARQKRRKKPTTTNVQ